MVPLQRPDEIQIPSQSWMQTSVDYEEMCNEQGIPTIITWTYGGKQVAVQGSWDNWKTRFWYLVPCLFYNRSSRNAFGLSNIHPLC